MFKQQAINTMKLHPDALRALGQLLDHRDALDGHELRGQSHRRDARYQFEPVREGVLELASDGGQSRPYLVYARNVSALGMSLFHGVFVAPGTRCMLTVPLQDGEQVQLPGVVKRCRLVGGRVHEIGVRFDRPVEVESFVVIRGLDAGLCGPDAEKRAAVAALAKEIAQACMSGTELDKVLELIEQARVALAAKETEQEADAEAASKAVADSSEEQRSKAA